MEYRGYKSENTYKAALLENMVVQVPVHQLHSWFSPYPACIQGKKH